MVVLADRAGFLPKLGNGVLWLTASNLLTGYVLVKTGTLLITNTRLAFCGPTAPLNWPPLPQTG